MVEAGFKGDAVDLSGFVAAPGKVPRTNIMSRNLVESEILRISWQVRKMVKDGRQICDLTLGDFSPKYFPIPDALLEETVRALKEGNTNYPPSEGILDLRQAVCDFIADRWGVKYPVSSALICGGARPVLYCAYRALLDPGQKVVYPLPSWNNNHYMVLTGGIPVEVPCFEKNGFLPQMDDLVKHLRDARIVMVNSPLNPAGTLISRESLLAICTAVVNENKRREKQAGPGGKWETLFMMYDQVYSLLLFGGKEHFLPPAVLPEVARYTILIDGISKGFAATGMRVGWALGPEDVIERMKAVLGHVGAWAPRAEQVAVARFLRRRDEMEKFSKAFLTGLENRHSALHGIVKKLSASGLPIRDIEPQGAIYMSLCFDIMGKRWGEGDGKLISTAEDIREFLLEKAGLALVPFFAFGMHTAPTWFRASVGGIGMDDIHRVEERLSSALESLR